MPEVYFGKITVNYMPLNLNHFNLTVLSSQKYETPSFLLFIL